MSATRELNQWRTVGSLLSLGVMFLIALAICRSAPNGPAMLDTTERCFAWLGTALASKAAIQHTANAIAVVKAKAPADQVMAAKAAG